MMLILWECFKKKLINEILINNAIIAKHLKFSFIDTDLEIENQENKTISQIFKFSGESYFRMLEKKF